MAADSTTSNAEPAFASDVVDPNRTYPVYKQLVNFGGDIKKLQVLIDKQTEELAEAKKAPDGEFQRAHIHQINNVLFRSGYELDQIHEEYRGSLGNCVEELQIDWTRMKSNWVQDENQVFQLQVLLAKAEYLRNISKDVPVSKEVMPMLETLLGEIERFTASHLSSGTLPDSSLEAMTKLVRRLEEVCEAAYVLATEVPPWRGNLAEPEPGVLSIAVLSDIQNQIKARIDDIPSEISGIQRLLPEGNWRQENDLRPEIYAFAELLNPGGPLFKIGVRDVLSYLENSPDSRLRRTQMDKFKNDATRCKGWLETREKHEIKLQQAVALAKEGNYLQAEEVGAEVPQLFSDLNYKQYREIAKLWLDQSAQLDKRMDTLLVDLEARLKKILQQPYLPLFRTQKMRRAIADCTGAIEKETRALEKYVNTDFYRETSPVFEQARARLREIEQWAIRRRALCRNIALMEAAVLASVLGVAVEFYVHSLELSQSSLVVQVLADSVSDPLPEIYFGSHYQRAFNAKFEDIPPGTYELKINSPGYYPKSYSLTLEPGKPMTFPPIKLIPIMGSLWLEPAQGDYDFKIRPIKDDGTEGDPVRIGADGSLVGHVTKGEALPVDLRPGRYRVYFFQGEESAPDYRAFDVVCEINAHQVTTSHPDFAFATLDITSEPKGATVSLDGKPMGTTPFVLRLAPIDYSLDVSLDNYESYYKPIHLNPGGRLPLNLVLKPKAPVPSANIDMPPQEAPSSLLKN